jgi:D-alanine-D-alanine ligase
MEDYGMCLGIAFNAFKALPRYSNESLSEEAVGITAHEVLAALTSKGHQCFLFPLGDDVGKFVQWLEETRPEVIINLCEGYKGIPQMEANVAAVLELMGIRFTGNSSKVLALCQDKYMTKAVLRAYGLPTPQSLLVTSCNQPLELDFPVIVKPNSEDGSLGIGMNAVVFDAEELQQRVGLIIKRYEQPALIEEFVDGREFNIAVYDDSEPRALPVSEIDFSGMPDGTPHICSYEAKWHEDSLLFLRTPPVCPAQIDSSLMARLQMTALEAFLALGCRDYARVDFRVADSGEIFILEVNPNPDISRTAGYARALAAAGIDYRDFWESMIKKAMKRRMQ